MLTEQSLPHKHLMIRILLPCYSSLFNVSYSFTQMQFEALTRLNVHWGNPALSKEMTRLQIFSTYGYIQLQEKLCEPF